MTSAANALALLRHTTVVHDYSTPEGRRAAIVNRADDAVGMGNFIRFEAAAGRYTDNQEPVDPEEEFVFDPYNSKAGFLLMKGNKPLDSAQTQLLAVDLGASLPPEPEGFVKGATTDGWKLTTGLSLRSTMAPAEERVLSLMGKPSAIAVATLLKALKSEVVSTGNEDLLPVIRLANRTYANQAQGGRQSFAPHFTIVRYISGTALAKLLAAGPGDGVPTQDETSTQPPATKAAAPPASAPPPAQPAPAPAAAEAAPAPAAAAAPTMGTWAPPVSAPPTPAAPRRARGARAAAI